MLDDTNFADRALMQDPAFARALCLCGQNPAILPNGMIVLRQKVMGVPLAMLPRAVPPANLASLLSQAGLAKTPLLLSPDIPCPLPRALRLRAPRRLWRLPLHMDPSQQRAALHPKWRNQLVKAEHSGLSLHHQRLPADPSHPILQTEVKQARTKGYANWPPALTAAFAAAAPDQTHLFQARCKDTSVAHMVFLSHGSRVSYHLGHTSEVGKERCAHNLILWRAITYFADQGHHMLELGPADARSPGLNRFKRRTGALEVPTGGTWLRWHPFARSA